MTLDNPAGTELKLEGIKLTTSYEGSVLGDCASPRPASRLRSVQLRTRCCLETMSCSTVMLETAACLLARHFKPNRAVHEHRERREREQYESREAQRDGAWQLRYHGRGTVLLSCHPSQPACPQRFETQNNEW